MLNNLRPTEAEYRDGIIRARRMLDALHPDTTAWDDRTLDDWLHFVQEFSQMVHYVNDRNQQDGYWEGLMSPQRDWATAFATPQEREEVLEEFRALFVTFAEGKLPETTTQAAMEQLSRPHRVLLLIFLRLLDQFRKPFNQLVARHLQYQMETLLRFEPQPAQADTVGVQVVLEDNAAPTLLPKGSVLEAGEDAEGYPLQYLSTHDTWLHTTQVGDVKSLFIKKELETLATVHEKNTKEVDRGFQKLLEFALGEKGIGTALPALPEDTPTLEALQEKLTTKTDLNRQERDADPHWYYMQRQLYIMDFGTFSNIMDIQERYLDSPKSVHTNEWPLVYGYLEQAYLRKQVEDRKRHLRTLYEAAPEAEGYRTVLRYAFGDPNPGDELADYQGTAANPYMLFEQCTGGDSRLRNAAEKFLLDDWYLTPEEFKQIHTLLTATSRTETDWDIATGLIEQGLRKKREIAATKPQREIVGNLYAASDPRTQLSTQKKDASHQAWPLFGSQQAPMPQLGFRLRSPLLALSGGVRTLQVFLSLDRTSISATTEALLQYLRIEKTLPIQSSIEVNGESILPNTFTYAYEHRVLGKEQGRWQASVVEGMLAIPDGTGTELQPLLGSVVLLDAEGNLRKPKESSEANRLSFEYLGTIDFEHRPTFAPKLATGTMAVYPLDRVFPHAIILSYTYALDAPSLFPIEATDTPELVITFDPAYTPTEFEWPWDGMVPALRDLKIEQMHLSVSVEELPLEEALSDSGTLDTTKPFAPFGDPCNPGDSFYFTHREVASKPLDVLHLDIDWMQLPESFPEYYEKYPVLDGNPHVHQNLAGVDTTPTLRVHFRDGALPLTIQEGVPMFSNTRNQAYRRLSIPVKGLLANRYPDYAYTYQSVEEQRELLAHNRYYTLEYTGPTFGQTHYEVANLQFFQKVSSDPDGKNFTKPNPPYVPKAKEVKLAYTSSATRTSEQADHELLQLQYLTPFGTRPFAEQGPHFMLPEYQQEGECYVGIAPVRPGQVLSLWFQMAEGSAKPGIATPTVTWHYPTPRGWVPFPDRQLLRDGTEGLTQSGMIYLQLPQTLAAQPELPRGLYWLRLSIARDTQGLPMAISIRTNGVNAKLAPGPRATSHYERPLPAESITELEESPITVKEILQPYSSSHGMPQELPEALYVRAGERIRHKQRAITQWDYERLVISQFADVYKVRCLSADHTRFDAPGAVKVIVIPDLRGKTPFNPLQPKLPNAQLRRIKNHLQQYCPPAAQLVVDNPHYVEVRVRFAVRIRPGYSPELSKEDLQMEVKRFLSPWAYEEGYEINFGGEIYANALVGYVETLPYVDYVARVRLFKRESGSKFIAVQDLDGMYRVTASEPDRILVSAEDHDIDLIGDAGYELSSFEGIQHDKIELDFQVGDS